MLYRRSMFLYTVLETGNVVVAVELPQKPEDDLRSARATCVRPIS